MRKRTALVWGVAIICFVVLMLVTPAIPQSQEYHNFADNREYLGIPNTLNVISNIPFFFVGLIGLVLCYYGNYFKLSLKGELCGWTCFFIGVAAVAFGSSYYHLQPNDARLMTVAFTSIIAIFIIERVDAYKGTLSIVPLLLAGVVSILYWRFCNDLRPYALVQFVPIVAIPVMALLLPPMYTHSTYWLWAAGFYLLAKVEEAADRPIYNLTHHIVSGHTLKHLCAAMVPVFLTLMLAKRDVTHERVSLIQMWRMSWTKVKENGANVESISYHIPAQETSLEFDERIDTLLNLPAETRKYHRLVTEENLLSAGLRPADPTMSESGSHAKAVPARKETPAERLERLGAERKRRAAVKRKRGEGGAELSVSHADVTPRTEGSSLPSPIRTGRAPGKEPIIDLERHYLPPNKDRIEPCAAMKGRRPTWFLDYVQAATPTAELLNRVPPVVVECSHIPIRGWTPKMEMLTNDMDPAEQVQFGNALMGRALATYAKAAGEFQSVAEKYQKTSAELRVLQEAHHLCPSLIKSLEDELQVVKGEMEILESRAVEAERLREEVRATAEAAAASQRRCEEIRAEYEGRVESSGVEGYAKGLVEGEAAFKKSEAYTELINMNYIFACQEILDLVKEGKTAEQLRVYIEGRAAELHVEPMDAEDLEAEELGGGGHEAREGGGQSFGGTEQEDQAK